jgi:hypothetical protein
MEDCIRTGGDTLLGDVGEPDLAQKETLQKKDLAGFLLIVYELK